MTQGFIIIGQRNTCNDPKSEAVRSVRSDHDASWRLCFLCKFPDTKAPGRPVSLGHSSSYSLTELWQHYDHRLYEILVFLLHCQVAPGSFRTGSNIDLLLTGETSTVPTTSAVGVPSRRRKFLNIQETTIFNTAQ